MLNKRIHLLSFVIASMLFAVIGPSANASQRVSGQPAATKKSDKQQMAVFAESRFRSKEWAASETIGALEDALLKSGFLLVARKELNTVKSELSLTLSSLFQQDKAVEVGNLLSAKYLVAAEILSITKLSRSKFDPRALLAKGFYGVKTSVRVRLLNTETGQIQETYLFEKESTDKKTSYPETAEDLEDAMMAAYRDLISTISVDLAEKLVSQVPEARSAPKGAAGKAATQSSAEKESFAATGSPAPKSKDPSPSKASGTKEQQAAKTSQGTKSNQAAKKPDSKTDTSASAAPVSKPGPAPTEGKNAIPLHGEVVSIDGNRVVVAISGVHAGQKLEVYRAREMLTNSQGEFLEYDYKPADKCARLKVVEVRSRVVDTTIEQTFDLQGKPESASRADRVVKFFPVKAIE